MENHELSVHNPTPQTLLSIAIEKGVDMGQLEKLMDLQERWEKKEAKKAFLSAMSDFQSKVPVLDKNKKVDFSTKNGGRLHYNYADLGEIASCIKDTLRECGLSYRWEIADEEGQIKCTCIVSHIEGHSECTAMKAEKDDSGQKNSIQQKGSTITYLQRYTLIGALGITTANADVDGHQEDKQEEAFNVETSVVTFGKHNGKLYKDLPLDYVQYLIGTAKPEDKARWQAVLDYHASKQQAPQQTKPVDIPAEDYLPEAASKYGLQQEDMDIWIGLVNECNDVAELKQLHNRERATLDKYPPLLGLLTSRRLQIQNQPNKAA